MVDAEEVIGSDLMISDFEYGADLVLTESEKKQGARRREFGDLSVISGFANLGQAILNRLRTRRGELAELGHPEYGSRLYELIGSPNDDRTRELVRVLTVESLLQEPRVRRVVSVRVRTAKDDPYRVDVEVSVLPVESEVPLSVVFPFYLEVA